jgi:pimeloyl-ACP methyl ester carboxylesterase
MSEPQVYQISVNSVKFSLLDWGRQGKPFLVLLHGLASSSHMFDLIAPSLADHYHVVAIDQRGHGLSEKPSKGYDFETIASDLDGLVSQLGADTFRLLGHSWGAYTALYYAATRPHKVKRVVLLDGGVFPLKAKFPTWEIAQTEMAPPEYRNRTIADIQHMIQKDWLGSIFREELLPLAWSIFDATDPANVHAHLCPANHMQIAQALWAFDPADYSSKVTCPCLLVIALQDDDIQEHLWHPYALQMEQTLHHCQVKWMAETAHDAPWHRPQELVAHLIPFLE